MEFSIPFYAKDHNYLVQGMFNNLEAVGTTASPSMAEAEIGSPSVGAYINILCPGTHTLRKRFDRSLGEDASFSYFVSCPPVYDGRL